MRLDVGLEPEATKEELTRKYVLAGKIRFISFSLLLIFLLLMKLAGGYSYLNAAFVSLLLVEAVLNQPYKFIIRRVNIYRFQYYQMMTDIIAISWILYYMGGIEAPLVTVAYYAIILWAGVVSTTAAVFFAAIVSALFFASIVLLEYFEMLPFVSYFGHKMPPAQMFSLVFGNVAFLFAFGYFGSRAASVITFLERKKQEESLKYAHKLLATGYLVSSTTHDALNCLATIKGYVRMLLEKFKKGSEEETMLEQIEKLELRSSELLSRLAKFSQKPAQELESVDIHKAVDSAINLTWPVAKYSIIELEKIFLPDMPLVSANNDQIEEVFVSIILSLLDIGANKSRLVVKTNYFKNPGIAEVMFVYTYISGKQGYLHDVTRPFYNIKRGEKALDMGLDIAREIIARHNGMLDIDTQANKNVTFVVQLPARQKT
ncbi:MAG: hypothetical protein V2A72_01165 [Candidatus Omnitrophota bacterium]